MSSSPFKRLASLRRSDTRIQRYKENPVLISPTVDSSFVYYPDSSYASSGDLTSSHFDPSWQQRGSVQHLSKYQQQQQQQQQQQLQIPPQTTGGKIRSLFRGLSIKRTRSVAKLDTTASGQRVRENNSSESCHSNTNNSSQGSCLESGSLQSASCRQQLGNSRFGADYEASSNTEQHQADQAAAAAAMKRSISMGRIGGKPLAASATSGSHQDSKAAMPGHQHQRSGPLGFVISCIPKGGSSGDYGSESGSGSQGGRQSVFAAVTSAAGSGGNNIRSAQSHDSLLVNPGAPLQLGPSTEVRPVHASLMPAMPPASGAFVLAGNPDRVNRYFAAASAEEAKQWQESLKKVNRPDLEASRHMENSLKLWVFEAKRLPAKKKYFCEICLNHILYARTTSKEKTADVDPFWGEPFEFSNLQEISLVTVKLFREANRKKKKDRNQLVGEIHLPVHQILSQTEQWYSIEPPQTQPGQLQHQQQQQQQQQQHSTAKQNNQPSLRLKCRYLSVDVLPLAWYSGLGDFLSSDYKTIVRLLEPKLPVRVKEDLASGLVALAHSRHQSETLVAELLLQELDTCGGSEASALVVFRGNSIATKSVEYYLKLVGSDYLRSILAEPVAILLRSNECCEVDPVRVSSSAELESNQRSLRLFAELFWTRIYTSADRLPPEFGRLFAGIRMGSSQRLCDQLVGASIFLRFICPAILGPSLFGLCQELPPAPAARSLTLIAKTVQNLANGASFGGKEAYMNFMNRFLEQHHANMAQFVARLQTAASQPDAPDDRLNNGRTPCSVAADSVDPGFELAQLHTLLSAAMESSVGKSDSGGSGISHPCLTTLLDHLSAVAYCLKHNCPPPVQQQTAVAPSGPKSGGDQSAHYSNGVAAAAPSSDPNTAARLRRENRKQQTAQQQPDWQRALLDHSPAAPSSIAATAAPVVSSATGGSSGYHSFSHRQQAAASPVQFLNPSYQKSAADLVLTDRPEPATRVVSQRQVRNVNAVPGHLGDDESYVAVNDDRYSSTSSSSEDDDAEEERDSEEDVEDLDDSSSTGTSSSPQANAVEGSRVRAVQQQQPPPLPPHRVRMGLSSVQQRASQQPPSPSSETAAAAATVHQLQTELSLTRRQLEEAETKLRSNELEKTRMMVEFERGAQEHERREAENSRQLAEIMARLQALEADFRSTNGGTASKR